MDEIIPIIREGLKTASIEDLFKCIKDAGKESDFQKEFPEGHQAIKNFIEASSKIEFTVRGLRDFHNWIKYVIIKFALLPFIEIIKNRIIFLIGTQSNG